ncbi:putative invertase inhibitor [Wolffia australiana]
MNSTRVSAFLLSALLLLVLFSRQSDATRSPGKSVKPKDFVSSTCRHVKYFDVCVSTLQSSPESSCADKKGLVLISLNACIAHAEYTVAYAQQLMNNATAVASTGDDGDYAKQCLDDCLTQYADALDELRETVMDAMNGTYDSVNAKVSAAMTDSESCEDGFAERPGLASPLAERNAYFSKLCSNALAVAQLLS